MLTGNRARLWIAPPVLFATSVMLTLFGAGTAHAALDTNPPVSGAASGDKITVKVWGNGLKAGSTGSKGGGPQYLPMLAVCWMTPYRTGKDYYHYVKSGQMALDDIHFGGTRTAEKDFELYKDDDKGHWYGPDCDEANWTVQNDSAGFTAYKSQFEIDNPYRYIKANDPVPQTAGVPIELLRDFAVSQLELPDPELNWNPKIAGNEGTLVNLRTWLWLDNAPQSLEVHASVPSGTQASVTATFGGMDVSAPGEKGFSCPNSGTPYTVGATTDCYLAFSRSSNALGTPKTTVTVATNWTATWEGTGVTRQPLTPSPTTDPVDTDIRVDEVQTLVTGTG